MKIYLLTILLSFFTLTSFAGDFTSVNVVINANTFVVNGKFYNSIQSVHAEYRNKKNMKLTICRNKGSSEASLQKVLNTFAKLNTLQMDVSSNDAC